MQRPFVSSPCFCFFYFIFFVPANSPLLGLHVFFHTSPPNDALIGMGLDLPAFPEGLINYQIKSTLINNPYSLYPVRMRCFLRFNALQYNLYILFPNLFHKCSIQSRKEKRLRQCCFNVCINKSNFYAASGIRDLRGSMKDYTI